MLSMIFFLSTFSPLLGIPCFQWCCFYLIFPPPPPAFLATLAFNDCVCSNFCPPPPPSWQPMLSMISFYQNFSPPPSWQPMLSMIFFLSRFFPPPPLSWQPMLSMIFFLSDIFPPRFVLATHALNDLPPSPCLRLVFIAYVLNDSLFIDFSFPPSWQPLLSMIFFLSKISPPPFLATHALNAFNDFLFFKYFSPSLRLGNPCFEWFASLPLPAPCF